MADLAQAVELWRGGRYPEAERVLGKVLEASPQDTGALRFLAEIYGSTGRNRQSIDLWRRLSALIPADASIMRQLAQALMAERDFANAVKPLRAAISLEPANARAHNNLGLAQLRMGHPAAAVQSLENAIRIDPGYALAHLNLGLAREQLDQLSSARSSYERAVQLDPHLTHARARLSELLRSSDEEAARRERDRALESHAINLMTVRRHDHAMPVWTQLIESGSRLDYLIGNRFHCQLQSCDWSQYAATAARLEAQVLQGERVDRPFSFFVYSSSAAAQLRCSRTFAMDHYPGQASVLPEKDPAARRITVAYLSNDFHEHATAYLVAGLLESHDRSRFEVIALSYGRWQESAMRGRIEAAVERYIDIDPLTDRQVADLMRELGVDIAVDLKGFTGGARTGIFAQRAAPVQINYLGYPGTLGSDYFHYIVADRHLIPEQDQVHYSEKVIYMPRCYQPNDLQRPLPTQTLSRAELGLPQGGFVFGCFNNLYKIAPTVFDTWLDLLKRVDGSVLWLLEGTATAMRNLRGVSAARGVRPERILFAPHISLAQHLARYRHVDLFLDTTPCNAHTTASDALWMGVPVLTLTGSTFAGRVATSLLHAVDLPQLCSTSTEEYSAKALRLATEPAELEKLKMHLEEGRGTFPLFATAQYCRDLESAYQEVWARHTRGERPTALSVGPRSEGAANHEQHS